jgi:hypothetical protein
MTTMTILMYSLLQDPQARCNVPLLRVYVQVYSLVWACLCLKFYWMFYLEIKSTLVILWSAFIPLKINNAMNNIYQLVLISCEILSLSSWPLISLTTIPKSEKFRFPKRVWSQRFRIRDCVPVIIKLKKKTYFTRCTPKKSVRRSDSCTSPSFADWVDDVAVFKFSLSHVRLYSRSSNQPSGEFALHYKSLYR